MTAPAEAGVKARVYVEALESLGFRPQVDADGDVTFRMEGRNLIIMADEDDPGFFRVLLPYFWNLSSAQERTAALGVALQLTGEYKAVKIFVDEERGNVSGSVELFFDRPEGVKAVLERILLALQAATREFAARMRGDTLA